MIRHLKNKPIIGRSRIAASLGLDYDTDSSIRQLYRIKQKFNLPIKKNEQGEFYIDKDDVCFFRYSLLSGNEQIAQFLKIGRNTLLKYMKEDHGMPVYKLQTKKRHRLYTFKNLIAHWYVNFLLKRSYRGNFVEFLDETRCGVCGKYLFIRPGGCNFREFSLDDEINESFIKEYIRKNPTCPFCGEETYPPDCHHRILNLKDLQRENIF